MSAHILPDVGSDPRRLIRLDAVHNFRDRGGYPTTDGRTTRWRMLFRADGLYRLAGADLEIVRQLGLRTVIDLRSNAELAERGTFPHEEHPVAFHHMPVIDSTWQHLDRPDAGDAVVFLEWAYHDMLRQGPERFAQAIEQLSKPEALPAVFHCAAGKDRTGVLAMLLLGALGVRHEYIVADYALTAEGTARMQAWAQREAPELWARLADTPTAFLAAVPEAMLRVINTICSHGTLRDYTLSLGVSPEALDLLAEQLLE
jgi:protein-tyrosine phosphatase